MNIETTYFSLFGLFPAIIFPSATLFQLLHLLKSQSASGVSRVSWVCFGLANISLFIYTQKYEDWFTIVTFLGTASLNFAIAILATYYQKASS